MKEIISKKETDKTNETVTRVKAIINDENNILLGYSNNDYQFPGGHVEQNETLINAIEREIKEETGINLSLNNIEPFLKISAYYKNYPKEGINRKTEIYYYDIKTNEKPNLNETNYTQEEIKGNYELKYIPLDKIEEELNNNIKQYEDPRGIQKEMINVIKEYKIHNNF